MTKFTGPLYVASAGSTDGADFAVSGRDVAAGGNVTGSAGTFTGSVSAGSGVIGGHTFAASSVTLRVPTTVKGSTPSSATRYFKATINSTVYLIPVYTSVA